MLQRTIYSREETGKLKIGMIKFLALTLYLVVRIALILISYPAIVGCFRKVLFQGFDLDCVYMYLRRNLIRGVNFLFTREFHPGMKFNLKENLPLSMKTYKKKYRFSLIF